MIEIISTAGLQRVSGIYGILNCLDGKIYIGSASSVKTRIGYHRSKLRGGIHDNAYLQNAWNLHGESNFKIFLLQECKIDDLMRNESIWMGMTNSFHRDFGYNLDRIAKRKMHSEETKRKISEGNKGKVFTEERRRKISIANTGKKHAFPKTEEQRRKYSLALMGHSVSEATRRKMSEIHKGKTISEEHKEKIREYWRRRRE